MPIGRSGRAPARRALALLAATGAVIGGACLLGAGPAGRAAGLPDGSSTRWLLRLFGIRELVLSLGLQRTLARDDPRQARLFADLITALQLGDAAVSTAMLRRRGISRALWAAVVLGAVPTMAAVRTVKDGYSR